MLANVEKEDASVAGEIAIEIETGIATAFAIVIGDTTMTDVGLQEAVITGTTTEEEIAAIVMETIGDTEMIDTTIVIGEIGPRQVATGEEVDRGPIRHRAVGGRGALPVAAMTTGTSEVEGAVAGMMITEIGVAMEVDQVVVEVMAVVVHPPADLVMVVVVVPVALQMAAVVSLVAAVEVLGAATVVGMAAHLHFVTENAAPIVITIGWVVIVIVDTVREEKSEM